MALLPRDVERTAEVLAGVMKVRRSDVLLENVLLRDASAPQGGGCWLLRLAVHDDSDLGATSAAVATGTLLREIRSGRVAALLGNSAVSVTLDQAPVLVTGDGTQLRFDPEALAKRVTWLGLQKKQQVPI
jgi:hypothetical protein